ncbi:hypothetical protein Sjap_006018 [Stephania japonica]|uniref:Reverse transcriptase Ty1/copia-type domain-containing protein n=1 Tax=Stephania japonica TaxID=461633 RepID=A0AAP0K7N0_9MAGN
MYVLFHLLHVHHYLSGIDLILHRIFPVEPQSTVSPIGIQSSPTTLPISVLHDIDHPNVDVQPPVVNTPTNTHPMITRAKDGISKKKVLFADSCVKMDDIPATCEIALKDPKWKEAMDKEYHALIKNGTWSLVPYNKNQNLVTNKWIFSIKRNSDGSINRYKARLVAKGFKQVPSIDFDEVYSLLLNLLLFVLYYH